MDYKRKLATAIATGALLLNAFIPAAFASTTIVISGNGTGSNNYANVTQTSSSNVTQTNNANVNNNVSATANTGNNKANNNTGGDVTIDTGKANVTANVSNTLNSNAAEVKCCQTGNTDVTIKGNGANSSNTVNLTSVGSTNVTQANEADVSNNVSATATTGDNKAKWNTGGDVTVKTGDATVSTDVTTQANANWAKVTPGGSGGGSDVALKILGNGAGSKNFIGATLVKSTNVAQENSASVENNVFASAKTGNNQAKYNTGGDVTIKTGKANVNADINNMVNFNSADVNCGCAFGLLAKIDGNGATDGKGESDDPNVITAALVSSQAVIQGNEAGLSNDANGSANTGDNKAKWNTGKTQGDASSVMTGASSESFSVKNSGNANVLGSVPPFPWPEVPPVSLTIDWSAVLAFFGMFVH